MMAGSGQRLPAWASGTAEKHPAGGQRNVDRREAARAALHCGEDWKGLGPGPANAGPGPRYYELQSGRLQSSIVDELEEQARPVRVAHVGPGHVGAAVR